MASGAQQAAFVDLGLSACDDDAQEGAPAEGSPDGSGADCVDVGAQPLIGIGGFKSSDSILTLKVGRGPSRIVAMGEKWGEILQLCAREVLGRTVGMLSGPNTDLSALQSLFESTPSRSQESMRITFYAKSGDPVEIEAAASVRAGDEVELRLLQLPGEAGAPVSVSTKIEATFLSEEPHIVTAATPAFHETYRWDARALASKGLSVLFGWRTDGQRFRNMIKRAQQGAVATSPVYTYPSYGSELCTRLTILPAPKGGNRLCLKVEVLPSFDCESRPAHRNLAENTSNHVSRDCGSGASLARSSSSESSGSSSSAGFSSKEDSPVSSCVASQDEALRRHLKVMKLHRASKRSQHKSSEAPAADAA